MSEPVPQQHVYIHQRPGNGLGTAGFVCGLIGLLFSPIPIVGIIAWPLVILGLALSSVGFSRGKKDATPTGLAVAGIACSSVGLLICVLWLVAFSAA